MRNGKLPWVRCRFPKNEIKEVGAPKRAAQGKKDGFRPKKKKTRAFVRNRGTGSRKVGGNYQRGYLVILGLEKAG